MVSGFWQKTLFLLYVEKIKSEDILYRKRKFLPKEVVMKTLAIVLVIISMSYGLQAPYLISATPSSDSSMSIAWRNNDATTTGYIILRKDSTETSYKAIDSVVSAAQLIYVDIKRLLSQTIYAYEVIAYNGSEVSAVSNSIQATTPMRPKMSPVLTAATLSVNSILLNWNNFNKSTKGFIIQRMDSTESTFHFIDSLRSPIILSYTDTTGLKPGTQYLYILIAYDGLDVHDTSNFIQVTTKQEIFTKPNISVFWNFETSTSAKLSISDNSNCEIGYRIYRSDGLVSPFNLIATISSSNPDSIYTIEWNDNTIALNQWYRYKVAVYKTDSSIYSNEISTFTLHSVPMTTNIVFQKLSDFPISLSGMSAKAGDSIILKENSSPAGKFTVINISNPLHPNFDGYIDSTALLSYPQQTLIPAFLKFDVFNNIVKTPVVLNKDKVLVCKGSNLSMYRIVNGGLISIKDSMVALGNTITQMLLLNDTLLTLIVDSVYSTSIPSYSYTSENDFIYPGRLDSSGFSLYSHYKIPKRNDQTISTGIHSSSTSSSNSYFYFHGCYKGNMLLSIKQWNSSTNTNQITTKDSSASIAFAEVNGDSGAVIPLSNSGIGWPNTLVSNTGYYLAPTENLCAIGSDLFVADVRDLPDGYHTAVANNSLYHDPSAGGLQNILLDTLNKRVYVFYVGKMSILSYQRQAIGIVDRLKKVSAEKGVLFILNPTRSGVTIVLPQNIRNANIFIYNLSGRMVDKIRTVGSNALFWKPKSRSMNFYVAVVKSEKEQYISKFMVR